MGTIGQVTEIRKAEECEVEWEIDDFERLLQKDDTSYYSPSFSFKGQSWRLRIEKSTKTLDFIILYLLRKFHGPPIYLEFLLGIKSSNKQINQEKHIVKLFSSYNSLFSYRFITECEFLRRRAEFLISGSLKVTCVLKTLESIGGTTGDNTAAKCSYKKRNFEADNDSSPKKNCIGSAIQIFESSDAIGQDKQIAYVKVPEKLPNDFKTVMLSGKHSDVTIKVEEEEFKLHKVILAARNPYFDSVFKYDIKVISTGDLTIEHCEPHIFRLFIDFLYTGEVERLSPENVCGLYKAACKFQDDQLKKICLQSMLNTFSVDTFCDYIVLSLRYDEMELFQKAVEFFTPRGKDIAYNLKWGPFEKEYPIQANELFLKTLDQDAE